MARLSSSCTRLLDLLNKGEVLSLSAICDRLGVSSKRQVRRLVQQLRAVGIEVSERWEGKTKVFYFADGSHRIPVNISSLHLAEDQLLALIVAAEASLAALKPTPLGEPLNIAFHELLGAIETEIYSFESENESANWHFGGAGATRINPDIFRDITTAVHQCQVIWIDYYSASSGKQSKGRPIEPYGMAVRGGSWLLVAYCRQSRGMRDFSLAGISRVQLLDDKGRTDRFDKDVNFNLAEYFRPRFSALSGGEIVDVRLLVEPDRAEYFRRKQYHPTQKIEQTHDDGRLTVSYRVAGIEEIRTFVQGWGVGVTALGPPELVDRLRNEAIELATRYSPAQKQQASSEKIIRPKSSQPK